MLSNVLNLTSSLSYIQNPYFLLSKNLFWQFAKKLTDKANWGMLFRWLDIVV